MNAISYVNKKSSRLIIATSFVFLPLFFLT